VVGMSDADFTIGGGSLTVTAPDGGETWPIGSGQTIQWTSSGLTGHVKIEVSRDGGGSWETVRADEPNDGTYKWTVKGPATTRARIRITSLTDPIVAGMSDGDFTIGGGSLTVVSPNGGESWRVGSTQRIQWTSIGLTGHVKIEVSRDGGTSWAPIIGDTSDDGHYDWAVKGPATTQARIRITSLSDPTVGDSSDTRFTIR
jgi:hypothetical protein